MALSTEELLKISKDLTKIYKGDKELDAAKSILECLDSNSITVDQLQTTRIGAELNSFRKAITDEQLSSMAKALIKHWKKHTGSDDGQIPAGKLFKNKKKVVVADDDEPPQNGSTQNGSDSNSQPPKITTDQPRPVARTSSVEATGDDVRDKCREMIYKSFVKDGDLPDGTLDPERIAADIEEKIFEASKFQTSEKYKSSLRARVSNLRDKKNRALRDNVLTGVISAARFAEMTSEEMASSEVKKMREQFTKEAINEYQLAQAEGTPSDILKCGKCGQKNCTYRQAQTRSADEPMTTFAFCNNCGNRWKFC